MGTPRRIDVDSTWILRGYVEDQISTNFHVVSMYFLDVISLIKKSMAFPRTFFDVILMVIKSTLFPQPPTLQKELLQVSVLGISKKKFSTKKDL